MGQIDLYWGTKNLFILAILTIGLFYIFYLKFYFRTRKITFEKVLWKLKAPIFLVLFIFIILSIQFFGAWLAHKRGDYQVYALYTPHGDLNSQAYYWQNFVYEQGQIKPTNIIWDFQTIIYFLANSFIIYSFIVMGFVVILFGIEQSWNTE